MRDDHKSLGVVDVTQAQDLPAGGFAAWLRRTRDAQLEGTGVDVPCGECTACCRSSYFVHIGPDESRALARIPKALLFPAPGQPAGNVVMGYDEHGHCPMLIDDRCSIYADRPLTCRTYDCRIFPAAGIEIGEADKALIRERTRRWKFDYPTQRDRELHSAVRAAAVALSERTESLPHAVNNSTRLAVLAVKGYEAFLKSGDEPRETQPDPESARAPARANDTAEARRQKSRGTPKSGRS